MSVLVLQGDRRTLGVRGEALVIFVGEEQVARRDIARVTEVHLYGDVQVSPPARHLCLLRGVDLVFLTPHGRWLGRLTSRESAAGERRLAQLSAVLSPERRSKVARAVVIGKIANQETHLRRIGRRTSREAVADALAALHAMRQGAASEGDLDVLRGIEGLAARLYFGAVGRGCSNPLFAFTGRSRRPPRDPINAALSFGYTLLLSQVESAIRTAGLDVYVGFLHEATRGNPAAALDAMEEWRPLVDAMIFGLFNRRELSPEDFLVPGAAFTTAPPDAPDTGPPAIHLAPVGREIVFRSWFARLDELVTVPGAGGRLSLRQAIAWQAAHLARVCEERDATYTPFRWT